MSRFSLGAVLLLSARLASAQQPDPPGALPYDLAFDLHQFLSSTAVAVTADGKRIAWDVRRPPPDSNLNARFLSNGTPTSVVGSRISIADRSSGRTLDVCPGGNCWRPSWSPDGATLAFYSDSGGPPQLWVYEFARGRARRLSDRTVKAKLWTGDEPRWSPDGRQIHVPLAPEGEYHSPVAPADRPAAKATPAPGDARVTVLASGSELKAQPAEEKRPAPWAAHFARENLAALASIELRTGRVSVIVPAEATPKPSVLRLSASGRWLTYLSVFKFLTDTSQTSPMDLAVVRASGGTPWALAENLELLSDYHGFNYAWHPSEDRLVYLKDKALWLVDFDSGAGPSPPHRLGASLGKLAPTVNWFTRDGKAVVVGIDPWDDKNYRDIRPRGFAVVPLDGGTPLRFALDDSLWLFRSIVKADERTVWQPDGASITLELEERATGQRAIVRFDPASGNSTVLWKGLARLDHLTGGGSHEFVVGTYEDLGTPPNLYRFPADFSSKERVSHIEPRLDGVSVGTAEAVETTVPMYDGTLGKARTAILLPAGAKRGDKLPAIVMMYPGSDASRQAAEFGGGSDVTLPTALFTSRGWAVVLASLPLGPSKEAGNPMQEMTDLLLPQLYRLAELGYIDCGRMALTGQSFGGYATAAIISRTNIFRAAVAVSGIYDLPGTYGHMDQNFASFWIGWNEGGQARMGTHPWASFKRYIDNSPYYQADKIFTPLLIVHGSDDLSYDDGQKLFTALRRLDRPAQFASYKGQGHVISEWNRAAAVDAARRMVEFYRRNLGVAQARE